MQPDRRRIKTQKEILPVEVVQRAGSIYEDGAGWKDAWRTGKKKERCLTAGRRNPQDRAQSRRRYRRICTFCFPGGWGSEAYTAIDAEPGRVRKGQGETRRGASLRTTRIFGTAKKLGAAKKDRIRSAGKPSGALFQEKGNATGEQAGKAALKERRAIEPWILRSKRKRRSLPRREEARRSPRNRMEETDM